MLLRFFMVDWSRERAGFEIDRNRDAMSSSSSSSGCRISDSPPETRGFAFFKLTTKPTPPTAIFIPTLKPTLITYLQLNPRPHKFMTTVQNNPIKPVNSW